jgi:hypothetical protein
MPSAGRAHQTSRTGSLFVVATATALGQVAAHEAGLASGIVSTFHEFGAAFGAALASSIAAVSNVGTSTEGFTRGFTTAAIVALVAAIAALTAGRWRSVGGSGADRGGNIGQHPTPVMHRLEVEAGQGLRQGGGQPGPVGQHPQRYRAGHRHHTLTVGGYPQIPAP